MKPTKGSSIFLFKQANTQADSRGLNTSTSRSRLRSDLRKVNISDSASRIKPSEYSLQNKPCLKACNMQDPQVRIKRDYSPLYQRSSQQSQLFEKGIKKTQRNINLLSRINLAQNLHAQLQKTCRQDLSPRMIKRSDPNKQTQNLLELGSKPQLSSRSVHKRNPNIESDYKEPRKQKSQIKDKNIESSRTADYVIKALCTNPSNEIKQIHMKFTKKQNIVSTQNLNNDKDIKPNEGITRQHKRHFSHIVLQANKQNIERKQNGICIKQDYAQKKKHERKQFNHDFYKKQDRMGLNMNKDQGNTKEKNVTSKTARYEAQPTNRAYLKTQYNDSSQNISRVAQLRKRFL